MKQLIRNILTGSTPLCEYAKIITPSPIHEKIFLQTKNAVFDISENHWILCITPFIFGVWIENTEIDLSPKKGSKYHIYISNTWIHHRKQVLKNTESALSLDLTDCIEEGRGMLLLLELKKTRIFHLDLIRRFLLFSRYYKKPGFSFQRFKSFVSAYSYPRQVRIVSFRQRDYYNIFPMDLLGDISRHGRFVFGLQCKNVTLPKIIETGRLVVSEASYLYKDIIYQLGKHHSGHPPALESLPFEVTKSNRFGFYIPAWVESYKEIQILYTQKLGSHMLLWGKIESEHWLTDPAHHLSTVHFLHFLHQKNNGHPYTMA